jgi:hypothetical protein
MAVSDDLIVFVRDALTRGLSRAQIEHALRQAGWTAEQIKGALAAFAVVDFPLPVPRPRPSLFAREAFLYLLLFTTLYVVAFNLGRLIFQLINRMLPDPASLSENLYIRESIRWSVSSLIVSFPVFLYTARLTSRTIQADRNQRASPVRRWLTYLTLFVAACVLIGDFMSLVYSFLGGELTMRFVLKVLTVGAIAGTLFGYYLGELRLDEKETQA